MNLKEVNRHRAIALEQARISQQKEQVIIAEANAYHNNALFKKSEVYKVRYEALRLYADHLTKQLRKNQGRQFKKDNHE